jgi:hypothetical protein
MLLLFPPARPPLKMEAAVILSLVGRLTAGSRTVRGGDGPSDITWGN